MSTNSSPITQRLRACGLKATRVRIAILTLLEQAGQPLSIEAIHTQISPAPNIATVYRTVNALTQSGLVVSIDFGQGCAFFESAHRGHHHHLVCEACGKVTEVRECIDNSRLQKILQQAPAFVRINRHSLELFGTCSECV